MVVDLAKSKNLKNNKFQNLMHILNVGVKNKSTFLIFDTKKTTYSKRLSKLWYFNTLIRNVIFKVKQIY